jgi:branched-chain amino acid transport system permease protein
MVEHIVWYFNWFREAILSIPGRVIALIFFAFLFCFPLITTHPAILRILTLAAIFAIYATSWDILAGVTGQVILGHGLFFGVGAYITGILNKFLGLPLWITIPMGSVGAVIVGLIASFPALRLRGFYLALVTLTFPVILSGIILSFQDFTGGEQGIYGLASLSSSRIIDYYIILLVFMCSVFIMHKIADTGSQIIRTGVVLHAIREDEITARASGIDTTKYKVLIFAIGGFFSGIAGCLYAHYITIAGPSTLVIFFSFQPILWTIFGGMGTIYGPVAGVFILYPFLEIASFYELGEQLRFVVFAVILIFALLFMPEGLTVWVRDKIELRCQRCKVMNSITRHYCRACRAPLHQVARIKGD